MNGKELRSRALRLRCPPCGQGRPFKGWFRLRETCDACGFRFERESGYFLGSIYLNYGVTAAVCLGWILVSYLIGEARWYLRFLPPAIFGLVFPLWFLRYSRALWMAFDLSWDPPEAREFER